MIGPVELITHSVAVGVVVTVSAFGLAILLNMADLWNRVVWEDHVTLTRKVHIAIKHAYYVTKWPNVARALPVLLLATSAAVAALAIFVVGLVEVFL